MKSILKYLTLCLIISTVNQNTQGAVVFESGFYSYSENKEKTLDVQSQLKSEASFTIQILNKDKFTIAISKNGIPVEISLHDLLQLISKIKSNSMLMIDVAININLSKEEMGKISDPIFKLGCDKIIFYSLHNSGIEVHVLTKKLEKQGN